MKSKEYIEEALNKEYDDRDSPKPMDEMDWAYNQGWIEALEFVLDIEKNARERARFDAILLTQEQRGNIIKNTIERIKELKNEHRGY